MNELTIEAIESRDAEAIISEAMNKYGQDILRLAYSYANNKAIAEDLTQDIFIKCYKSLHTFTGKSTFKTWWENCHQSLQRLFKKLVQQKRHDFRGRIDLMLICKRAS